MTVNWAIRSEVEEGEFEERMECEGPGHETQGCLLTIHPVGSRVGRIGLRPGLDQLPECLRILLIPRRNIGPDKRVGHAESTGLPDELNVHLALI